MKKKRDLKDYYVEVPLRGTMILKVEAGSAAEAKRLVDARDGSVEEVDHTVWRSGKATSATEDL